MRAHVARLQPNGLLSLVEVTGVRQTLETVVAQDLSDDELVRMHCKIMKDEAKAHAVSMVELARLHPNAAIITKAHNPARAGKCPHCGSGSRSVHRSVMGFGECRNAWHVEGDPT